MELALNRIARVLTNPADRSYTIGKLYINCQYFCDTLEPYDRLLTAHDTLERIARVKEAGRTAIPTGSYLIDFTTWSHAFGHELFYRKVCSGYVPRLMNVPGYDGILIHAGNTWKDTRGCPLVGYNRTKATVLDSKETFQELYRIMKNVAILGEEVRINVTRNY